MHAAIESTHSPDINPLSSWSRREKRTVSFVPGSRQHHDWDDIVCKGTSLGRDTAGNWTTMQKESDQTGPKEVHS